MRQYGNRVEYDTADYDMKFSRETFDKVQENRHLENVKAAQRQREQESKGGHLRCASLNPGNGRQCGQPAGHGGSHGYADAAVNVSW